jgi:hypothetical protein
VSNPHQEPDRERAIRAMRAKRHTRIRADRRKAAVQSGEALFVSVAEFAVLTGISPATIYRRLADGTLKSKKLVGRGNHKGRTLVDRSQLG